MNAPAQPTTPRPQKYMLRGSTCEKIRAAGVGTLCPEIEYGRAEAAVGTGRATCRCCGEKIQKGELALKFPWDMSPSQSGSFTTTVVQIHAHSCPSIRS